MKKQFLQFFAMLIACVAVSSSAFAADEADGRSLTEPYALMSGATKTFSVTGENLSSTFNWDIYTAPIATDLYAGGSCKSNTDHVASFADADVATSSDGVKIKFSNKASGLYYIEVEEVFAEIYTGGCEPSTKRGFFVQVFSFDAEVFACTSAGVEITDDNLLSCNDNTYTAFANEFTDGEQSLNVSTDGDLASSFGKADAARSTRYIAIKITPDNNAPLQLTGFNTVQFTFAMTGTNGTTANYLHTVNGEDASDYANLDKSLEAEVTAAGSGLFVIPIVYNDRFNTSNNIDFDFSATEINLFNTSTAGTIEAGDVSLGEEKASNVDTDKNQSANDNKTSSQKIFAKPSTSKITIN